MISVDIANQILRDNTEALPPVKMALEDAAGYVLAEDVLSKIDFPPFNQSNVDGYAIAFSEVNDRLTIQGISAAGSNMDAALGTKQAMRIFTGAPVPSNADTVVMQEKVIVNGDLLMVDDDKLQQGVNFRPKGKDMQRHNVALRKGELLVPGAVGFLTALGVVEVTVYSKPVISIIITGNELQQPGATLQYGQVYEANSHMLKSALEQLHFNEPVVHHVADDLQQLGEKLQEALESSDLALLCGGISVGDYDYVLQAANDCGVTQLFHKIKQRPGKPLYFGKKDQKLVFGLPGNPSSVLTCFYLYVAEALALMTKRKSFIKKTKAALQHDHAKAEGLAFFLKGLIGDDQKVIALDAQESYRLSSYARASCLIRLAEERTMYTAGEEVDVYILPD